MNSITSKLGRVLREHATGVYAVAAGAVVVSTSAALALLAAAGGVGPGGRILAAILALPLGAWYAGRIARPVATHVLKPSAAPLPRLATDGRVPREWRTLVAIPAIVATPERARELLGRLAQLAHQHADLNLRFALLADFADAPTHTTESDAAVLSEEQRLVERINADLRDEAGDRVFVLHRERAWYAADDMWIGWERKRGKLLELHRLLIGRSHTTYRWTFGEFAEQLEAGEFAYVFTLDEANWLPPGALLSMLRVAAHPANRARLDPTSGRLEHGYAIFQPVVVSATPTGHPEPGGATHGPLGSGAHGMGSHFWFDVLGVGVFLGKGLLDVRACHALLDEVFPTGVVLQHDVLEGFVARTAEVRDAFVLEAMAPSYLSQVRRGHRWLRGYFQLFPWLLPRVRSADGARRRNPLRGVHRLFVLELMLPELARPASLVLLIAGWFALRSHAAAWTVLACPPLALMLGRLGTNALNAARQAALRALRPRPASEPPLLRPFLLASGVDALATTFSQATLPYEAVVVADAVCRAMWRLLVSRRHLLDWPQVSRLQMVSGPREKSEYRSIVRVCLATGLLTLVGVAALRPMHLPLALPFVAAWMGAPSLAAWVDSILVEQTVGAPSAAAPQGSAARSARDAA